MIRNIALAALAAIFTLAVPVIVAADETASEATSSAAVPTLKQTVTVNSHLVRIGDLITDAGSVADVAVFRAPDLGETGMVSARRVLAAVRQHDLVDVETHGISEVSVTRASRRITPSEIEERILDILTRRHGAVLDAPRLRFDVPVRTIQVEPDVTGPLKVSRLAYDRRAGRFDITFELPGSIAARHGSLRYIGTMNETAEVPVLVRAIQRGKTVHDDDVVIERRAKRDIGTGMATSAGQLVGLAARRSLRAGHPVRIADLTEPQIVDRNDLVTIVYEVPGIVLTVRGKAQQAGAKGDVIDVLNVQSKRTIQAKIIARGYVTITSRTPGSRVALSTRRAASTE